LAPASKVSATTRWVVGMTVQSVPASQPVTGRVPGDAGLGADGRGDGVAGGTVLAGVPRGEVTGAEAGGADVPGAGVVPVPGCAPGEGAPLQAASAVTAAPATASRVISQVLMPSACAGPGGLEWSEGPFPGVDGHRNRTFGPHRGTLGVLSRKQPGPNV
jgi:hypothetical protein